MQDNTGDFWAILQDIHNLKNRTLQDKLYDNHTFCTHTHTHTHTHDIHELPLSVPTNKKTINLKKEQGYHSNLSLNAKQIGEFFMSFYKRKSSKIGSR